MLFTENKVINFNSTILKPLINIYERSIEGLASLFYPNNKRFHVVFNHRFANSPAMVVSLLLEKTFS